MMTCKNTIRCSTILFLTIANIGIIERGEGYCNESKKDSRYSYQSQASIEGVKHENPLDIRAISTEGHIRYHHPRGIADHNTKSQYLRNLPVIEGECDEAYNVIGIADECLVNTGKCPTKCHGFVADADAVCQGELLTNNDGSKAPYKLIDLLPRSLAVGQACIEVPVQFLLENGDDLSCQEWLLVNQLNPFLRCSDTCTKTCKDIIDKVYATCNPTDTFTGSDGQTRTAQELENSIMAYRNEDCNIYAESLSFLGGKNGGTMISCNITLTSALFEKSCAPTDDIFQVSSSATPTAITNIDESGNNDDNNTSSHRVCSTSTCQDFLMNIHEACNGKMIQLSLNDDDNSGKDNAGIIYTPSLLVTHFALLHEACQDVPLIFLTGDNHHQPISNNLSCQEWLEINSIISDKFCIDECTEVCKSVIDWTYSTCKSTDIIEITRKGNDNNSSGENMKVMLTASELETEVSTIRHMDCTTYANTLSFAADTPSASPVEMIQPTKVPVDEPTSNTSERASSSFIQLWVVNMAMTAILMFFVSTR